MIVSQWKNMVLKKRAVSQSQVFTCRSQYRDFLYFPMHIRYFKVQSALVLLVWRPIAKGFLCLKHKYLLWNNITITFDCQITYVFVRVIDPASSNDADRSCGHEIDNTIFLHFYLQKIYKRFRRDLFIGFLIFSFYFTNTGCNTKIYTRTKI